jgi:hypothetical protein
MKWHGRKGKGSAYTCSESLTPSAMDPTCFAFHSKEQGNFDNETDKIILIFFPVCIQ